MLLLSRKYRPAIAYLLAILFAEFLDSYIAFISARTFSHSQNMILTYVLIGAPIFFAPLQAGLSDIYGKGISLVIAVIICVASLVGSSYSFSIKSFTLLFIFELLVGLAGNIQPIAWAGMADLISGFRLRFYLALSICFLAIGSWGALIVVPLFSIFDLFLTAGAIAFLVFIASFLLIKISRKSKESLDKGLLEVMHTETIEGNRIILFRKYNALAYWSFYFSEIAFYLVLWRIILNAGTCLILYPIAIGIGYSIGSFTINKLKKNNAIVAKFGLKISLICIFLMTGFSFWMSYTINSSVQNTLQTTLFTLYAFYSFGYALFTPSLFSLIIPKNLRNETGKIFGLLESTDSIANVVSFTAINFFGRNCKLHILFAVSFAFLFLARIIFKKLINDHFEELNEIEEEINN